MVAYLLFCILCVLLAFFIGGLNAAVLWFVGTIAVMLWDIVRDALRWLIRVLHG